MGLAFFGLIFVFVSLCGQSFKKKKKEKKERSVLLRNAATVMYNK